MDLEMIILNEIRQAGRDKYMLSFICGIWHIAQVNVSIEQKQTHRHREQAYGGQGGGKWGKDGMGEQIQTIVHRMDKQGPTI